MSKRDYDIPAIHLTAKNMLTRLLDDAEQRDYEPPADQQMVADLEWIIAETAA